MLRVLAAFLLQILLFSSQGARAATLQALPLLGAVDLFKYIFPRYGYGAAIVGLLDENTLLTARYSFDGRSTLDFWNVKTGQVRERMRMPFPVDPKSVTLSPDGKQLMAVQTVGDLPVPVDYPTCVYLWDLAARKLLRTINFGKEMEVSGAFFVPGDPDRAIVTVNAPLDATDHPRFSEVNLRTGKVLRVTPYRYAANLDSSTVIYSPDSRLLIGLYPATVDNPRGTFDVFDAKTLHVLKSFDTHHSGDPVDRPIYFIDQQNVAMGSLLYNTTTWQTSRLLSEHPARYVLGGVPAARGYAFFVSRDGLELWNVPEKRMFSVWPLPQRLAITMPREPKRTETVRPETLYFSRDCKSFCFQDDRGVVRVYSYDFNALPEAVPSAQNETSPRK